MSTMAQAAAPLAVYFVLRNRNKKMSDLSLSSAVSGFLGVTEPGLYGVIVKYKVAFIATSIGGGIGAAIASAFGAAEYGMVMSSLVTIPATIGEGFMGIVIGLPTAIIVTMAIIFIFKNKLIEQDGSEEIAIQETKEETDDRVLLINSPVEGRVKPLSELEDDTFAKELIGKGIAISPVSDDIYSPVNGVITSLFPTKHAIGIQADNGLEILIHVGIDTVNLNGECFESNIKQGDKISKGQKILTFNREEIQNKGYSTDVIVVITNSNNYLDVFPNTKVENVTTTDRLLQVIA